jgi:ribosomal protein L35AE/L33A
MLTIIYIVFVPYKKEQHLPIPKENLITIAICEQIQHRQTKPQIGKRLTYIHPREHLSKIYSKIYSEHKNKIYR